MLGLERGSGSLCSISHRLSLAVYRFHGRRIDFYDHAAACTDLEYWCDDESMDGSRNGHLDHGIGRNRRFDHAVVFSISGHRRTFVLLFVHSLDGLDLLFV